MADETNMGESASNGDTPDGSQAPGQGWYLYGITHRDDPLEAQIRDIPGMSGGAALLAIGQGAVAALVQPVPLSEFGPESLAARLDDVAWIEAAARRHHEVIATLHQLRAVLPARFGAVYPTPNALRAVLAAMEDSLRVLLQRVAGCDEWEVRLYCDRTALLRTLDADYPALAELRKETEVATPGRAYLLRRKLDDTRAQVAGASVGALAREAHDNLVRRARASHISTLARGIPHTLRAGSSDGASSKENKENVEEIFRADYLVPRVDMPAFNDAMERFAAAHEGTRWTCSGPWPPYSAAMPLADLSAQSKGGSL